jgi:hypothetical protein
MDFSLILVPYHLGVERVHMGLGPERILQAGIHRALSARSHDVAIEFTLGFRGNPFVAQEAFRER